MADRKKAPKFTTPRMTLLFPKLDKPDYGNEKYPKPDGEYSTQALIKGDSPEAKKFIAQLMPLYEEAMEWAEQQFKALKVETRKKLGSVTRNDLFGTVYDNETEEPTGDIRFKFAMPASGIRNKGKKNEEKWTAAPAIFDAKGKPMRKCPQIWSGTTAKISFTVGLNADGSPGYFIPGTGAAGLKLKLSAVQIIDLVSGGQRSASSYGFEEEDGYEYDESDVAEDEDNEDTSSEGESKSLDEDEIPF